MGKSLQWSQLKMPVASIIWLVSMLVITISTYNTIPIMAYGVFGLLAILFFSGSDRLSFFYYVILTVATVFVFLVLAFRENWTPGEQAQAIGLHFVFLIHLFALYSLTKYIYQFRTENRFLRERVLKLEDFISEEGVLTRHEFEKQAAIILSTMARRNETGYFIQINLSKFPRKTKRTSLVAVGGIVHTTVRDHYDIVGKIDEHTIGFLLQNTTASGLETVKARIEHNMKNRFEEQAIEKMSWTITTMEDRTSLDMSEVLS